MQRRDWMALLAGPALTALGLGASGAARAQGSVGGTTKLLVGATPGGGTDLVARALAQELSAT